MKYVLSAIAGKLFILWVVVMFAMSGVGCEDCDDRIQTDYLPEGKESFHYSYTLKHKAYCDGEEWIKTAGELPPGIQLSYDGDVVGTPRRPGVFDFTVGLVDDNDYNRIYASKGLTLKITECNRHIITAGLPDAKVETSYYYQLEKNSECSSWWRMGGGQLPDGLLLTESTGVISGVPYEAGTFTFTIRLTNETNTAEGDSRTFNIHVDDCLRQITTPILPDGRLGNHYSFQLQKISECSEDRWVLQGGNLPPGISLNSQSGILSGIPTATGTYNFTVKLTNTTGSSIGDSKGLSLLITE